MHTNEQCMFLVLKDRRLEYSPTPTGRNHLECCFITIWCKSQPKLSAFKNVEVSSFFKIGVFGSLETTVFCLFTKTLTWKWVSSSVNRCTQHQKSITINYCKHRVHKKQSLLQSFDGFGLVSLNFLWKHVLL